MEIGESVTAIWGWFNKPNTQQPSATIEFSHRVTKPVPLHDSNDKIIMPEIPLAGQQEDQPDYSMSSH